MLDSLKILNAEENIIKSEESKDQIIEQQQIVND